jgi:hypothetical protein
MAAAPAPTYTLDVNDDGDIIIKYKGTLVHTTPLGDLLSPKNGPYTDVAILINDQKEVNYLDAIKDGTEVFQLKGLEIYNTGRPYPTFPTDLHTYEGGLLTQKIGNLSRTTWLKTKVNSQLNLIQSAHVFWESGLGYDSFIELLQDKNLAEIVTFGSYIDPLSKPGKTWPSPGENIMIEPTFMNQFGFDRSSIQATTRVPEITPATKGAAFQYEMNIACGKGCPCTIEHGGNVSDTNDMYFKGNEVKNKAVKELQKSQKDDKGLKTKLIVAKGWGDKVQVMAYYMFYHLHEKNAIMITCDFVVFCFCITLNIPCVYTGVYNRDILIPHQEVAMAGEKKEKKSYYSILQFLPGSPVQNAVQTYRNSIIRIMNENQEFIDNVSELSLNPNTPINVQGTPMKFNKVFYDILVTDMKAINALLEARTEAMKDEKNIDTIVKETDDLKKNFLIIPMFKFINSGAKITFLQTKLYTSDKTLELSINKPPHDKKNTKTFFEIALKFKTGGAITRAQARAAIRRQNGIMIDPQKVLFPRRDYTQKIATFLPEDIHENKYEKQGADTLFYEDGFGMEQRINLQGKFDINMYRAIESLSEEQEVSDEHVEYNRENRAHELNKGGRRRKATRRRQKGGGGVDETLFETLYTLYVYRAQYDIELDTPDQSINMKVLRELYKDYPKSTLNLDRRMTLKNVTGENMVTYTITGGPVNTRKQPANMRSPSTGNRVTGMTSANRPIYRNTYMRNTARPIRSHGGRITRRKKRNHRTRK